MTIPISKLIGVSHNCSIGITELSVIKKCFVLQFSSLYIHMNFKNNGNHIGKQQVSLLRKSCKQSFPCTIIWPRGDVVQAHITRYMNKLTVGQ